MPMLINFFLTVLSCTPAIHFKEPACIWRAVANNPAIGSQWRRYSVSQLFRRHVSPGMTLAQLNRLLDRPTWLDRARIQTVMEECPPDHPIVMLFSGPAPPISLTSEGTGFSLAVFSEPGIYGDVIYLRISGRHTRASLLRLLAGESCPDLAAEKILEIGFAPDVTGFLVPPPRKAR